MTDADIHREIREASIRINAGFARIAEARREHPEWFPLLPPSFHQPDTERTRDHE